MQYEIRDGVLHRVKSNQPETESPPELSGSDPSPPDGQKQQAELSVQLAAALEDPAGLRPDSPLFASSSRDLAQAMTDLGLRGEGHELRSSRESFAGRLQGCDPAAARRLYHAWHLDGMPECARRRAQRTLSLTFLAGPRRSQFPPHPSLENAAREAGKSVQALLEQSRCPTTTPDVHNVELTMDLVNQLGLSWVDLRDVRAVALVRGRGENQAEWSLRVLTFWLDPGTHQLVLGGRQYLSSGTYEDHDKMVMPFGPGTVLGSLHGRRTPAWVGATHQAGIDLAYATELAVSTREGISCGFAWPRPWVGFVEDGFQPELTPGLVDDTLRILRLWCARQRPSHPAFLSTADYRERVPEMPRQWSDVEHALGQELSDQLLEAVWYSALVRHDGLCYLPLDYFLPGSVQRPLDPARCRRAVLSFGMEIMGRETIGREGMRLDPFQARAQVLSLARQVGIRAAMLGQTHLVQWDLRSRREARLVD